MKKIRILSLGAGVQSSTLALMIQKGEVPMVDCGIFADTGAEPKSVYDWINFLRKQCSFPIYVVKYSNLDEDIRLAANGNSKSFSIPFYAVHRETKEKVLLSRQCTEKYKIKPIIKKVRELLGYSRGQRVYLKNNKVEMLLGISRDEMVRMRTNRLRYIENQYPLINDFRMNRQDCLEWMNKNKYPLPKKSACYFCPFHSNGTWIEMKREQPEEFKKAVQLDHMIRDMEISKNPEVSSKYNHEFFLHRNCVPLDEAVGNDKQQELFPPHLDPFNNVCDEGMCGV